MLILIVFLGLFVFIPGDKEALILSKLENMSNSSSNNSSYEVEIEPISDYESKIILDEMKSMNGSGKIVIENLSDKDDFVLEKELEEKNRVFIELQNLSE